jgi:ComF family protein
MELAQNLLSNLFPSRCILCRKTVNGQSVDGPVVNERIEICSDCFKALPRNDVYCMRCALPLTDDVSGNVLCGRCIQEAPAYDYAYSPFRYEDGIINLVHQLKFGEKITYARTLGEILLNTLQEKLKADGELLLKSWPDCLLPVPLHNTRLRQRGFNQSIEIVRVIAKKLKIPIEYNAVIRQRSTSAQTGLNAAQRKKNIKGAFSLVSEIKEKHVLIIDDVMTTGSTVNELAKLLKKNKVECVGVLSIARAPLKN